jgi:hypothetical protein
MRYVGGEDAKEVEGWLAALRSEFSRINAGVVGQAVHKSIEDKMAKLWDEGITVGQAKSLLKMLSVESANRTEEISKEMAELSSKMGERSRAMQSRKKSQPGSPQTQGATIKQSGNVSDFF